MRITNSEEEYLVDLIWPELLPKKLPQPKSIHMVPGAPTGPDSEPTFKLMGWRGAGWHIVFLEKPTR